MTPISPSLVSTRSVPRVRLVEQRRIAGEPGRARLGRLRRRRLGGLRLHLGCRGGLGLGGASSAWRHHLDRPIGHWGRASPRVAGGACRVPVRPRGRPSHRRMPVPPRVRLPPRSPASRPAHQLVTGVRAASRAGSGVAAGSSGGRARLASAKHPCGWCRLVPRVDVVGGRGGVCLHLLRGRSPSDRPAVESSTAAGWSQGSGSSPEGSTFSSAAGGSPAEASEVVGAGSSQGSTASVEAAAAGSPGEASGPLGAGSSQGSLRSRLRAAAGLRCRGGRGLVPGVALGSAVVIAAVGCGSGWGWWARPRGRLRARLRRCGGCGAVGAAGLVPGVGSRSRLKRLPLAVVPAGVAGSSQGRSRRPAAGAVAPPPQRPAR